MCRETHKLPISLVIVIVAAVILTVCQSALGLQFHLWKEECFSQKVEDHGDLVRVSFVVMRHKSVLHASTAGVDLVIKGPNGEQMHDDRDKKSEHFEFVARKKGLYNFCFTNKDKYLKKVDFNVAINHEEEMQPVKDEHLAGVKELINTLQAKLKKLEFEQRWLISEQYSTEEDYEDRDFWAITKAALESVALVGSSVLQVYLLKRLFKPRLGDL